MRRIIAALLLCALSASAQVSYWFQGFQRQGNAQLAQQYFFLPGTNIFFTYDLGLQHVIINASGGGGGGSSAFATNALFAVWSTNWTGSNALYLLAKSFTNGLAPQTNIWATNLLGFAAGSNTVFTVTNGVLYVNGTASGGGGALPAGVLTNFSSFNWTNAHGVYAGTLYVGNVNNTNGYFNLANNGTFQFTDPNNFGGILGLSYSGSFDEQDNLVLSARYNGQSLTAYNAPASGAAGLIFVPTSGANTMLTMLPGQIVEVSSNLTWKGIASGNGAGITNIPASGISASFVLKSGDTMSGYLTNSVGMAIGGYGTNYTDIDPGIISLERCPSPSISMTECSTSAVTIAYSGASGVTFKLPNGGASISGSGVFNGNGGGLTNLYSTNIVGVSVLWTVAGGTIYPSGVVGNSGGWTSSGTTIYPN